MMTAVAATIGDQNFIIASALYPPNAFLILTTSRVNRGFQPGLAEPETAFPPQTPVDAAILTCMEPSTDSPLRTPLVDHSFRMMPRPTLVPDGASSSAIGIGEVPHPMAPTEDGQGVPIHRIGRLDV